MVASFTQLLRKRYQGQLDAQADQYIHFAVDGATRMQRLIQDLLEYSRVDRHGRAPAPVDADAALRCALRNLASAMAESAAVVTHDALPLVLADETQLVQLLQNLIGNAIKFRGDAAPRVHISSADADDRWRITVRDEGIGIDQGDHVKIFALFQRLHTREEYDGTGLGLSICKKIVERHGGRIWVESAPGLGSAFHFTMPKAPAMLREAA